MPIPHFSKAARKKLLAGFLITLASLYLFGVLVETITAQRQRRQDQPIGQIVQVDGKPMHIYCTGTAQPGQPLVVLEAGGGDNLFTWYPLQQEISRFARVCSYDRAGYGWSAARPEPRTAPQIARELHRLLEVAEPPAAGTQPSYVLAGHSFGGLIMRSFAQQFPNEVAGLVLVDSTDAEDMANQAGWVKALYRIPAFETGLGAVLQQAGIVRLLDISVSDAIERLPGEVRPRAQALYLRAGALWTCFHEQWRIVESAEQISALGTFEDLPVIALISPYEDDGTYPSAYLRDFAALSGKSQVRKVIAGHYIHLDQPEPVLESIQEMVER